MMTALPLVKRAGVAAIAAALLVAAPTAVARGGHHNGVASHHRSTTRAHQGRAYPGVARRSHGRIARSPHAKEAFRRSHPCPATGKAYGACPGYVIDHIQALKHGRADAPYNMQWQTRAAAKAKDRWE